MAWETERPGQQQYRKDYDNKGVYRTNQGKPYINPDIPVFVPKEGNNCIRIVDPIELKELGAYYFEVWYHRDVGLRGDYFTCPKMMGRWDCPLCEKQTRDLYEEDEDKWKSFSAGKRRLMWVLDLNDAKDRDVLKLWICPFTLHEEILTQSRDAERDVFKDISNPNTGCKIFFDRKGKGRTTKYSGVQLGSEYPVGENIDTQRMWRFREDVVLWAPYEEIKASMDFKDGSESEANDVNAQREAAEGSGSFERDREQPPSNSTADSSTAEAEYDMSDLEKIDPNNVDCFRQKFDQYEECDTCPDRELCQKPWPVIKKEVKTEKTTKTSKAEKTTKTSKADAGGSSATNTNLQDSKSPEVQDKVAAAKARLQEQLSKRGQ